MFRITIRGTFFIWLARSIFLNTPFISPAKLHSQHLASQLLLQLRCDDSTQEFAGAAR